MRDVVADRAVADTSCEVQRRRSGKAGHFEGLRECDEREQVYRAGTLRHTESVEVEAPISLKIDAVGLIGSQVQKQLPAQHDTAVRRITGNQLTIGVCSRVSRIAGAVHVVAALQDVG